MFRPFDIFWQTHSVNVGTFETYFLTFGIFGRLGIYFCTFGIFWYTHSVYFGTREEQIFHPIISPVIWREAQHRGHLLLLIVRAVRDLQAPVRVPHVTHDVSTPLVGQGHHLAEGIMGINMAAGQIAPGRPGEPFGESTVRGLPTVVICRGRGQTIEIQENA